MPNIKIIPADLNLSAHREAVLAMLDAYAADPMGDARPLSEYSRTHVIEGLRAHPTTLVLLAMQDEQPVGVAVCFRGFSTFAAKPLLNLHDFYVDAKLRGAGVGLQLMQAVEQAARDAGCCKLTLEVQQNNLRAKAMYERYGYAQCAYPADEHGGGALFIAKPLE